MAGGTDNNVSVCDLEDIKSLEIQLDYTPGTPTTPSNTSPLKRVVRVRRYLDRLPALYCSTKHKQTQTQLEPRKKPERKPTFDFYNPNSDENFDSEELATAKMSSEKASNAKDKLEGTYQGRV